MNGDPSGERAPAPRADAAARTPGADAAARTPGADAAARTPGADAAAHAPGADAAAHAPGADAAERARADLYAVFARLFQRGPDAPLLAAIAGSAGERDGSEFTSAWSALAEESAAADPDALQQEFDEVFVGTGRAAVTPYCSYYIVPTARERVLVGLRDDLASLGLFRSATAREPEDHIAALLEVMRHLIGGSTSDAALHDQRQLFARYIEPAYRPFSDAVLACEAARYYRCAANALRAFLDVESRAMKFV